MQDFVQSMLTLVTETSTNLPPDVRWALARAIEREEAGNRSSLALGTIANNIAMAEENALPICQDTGMPTFFVKCPVGANQIKMAAWIREAVATATKEGKLRTNSVDSLTGYNSGDNLGPGTPVIHFEQWENDDEIEVRLILKGGGCENKNIQYSLPCELEGLGKADRTIEGVRKAILHAVWQAQGFGCSAGFIGVGIGGDRTTGYELAKQQLLRPLDDVNPDPDLAKLEDYIMANADKLGIGTMGFGGDVTLLGCKIGAYNRLPASFFVSVAYNCWAFRRLGVILDARTGAIKRWLYRDQPNPALRVAELEAGAGARQVTLTTPLTEEQVRSLRVGDIVILNGDMFTGRDALHHYLMDHDAPVDLEGAALYHCGPVMLKDENGAWHVKAAGPTTSSREEPYQADIIRKFGIRAVIGKGGMGKRTSEALKEHGAVYLNAIGGAAQYYAECIKEVKDVHFLEQFGVPEAMWHYRVEGFAAIVTMDAHGNSLHADILDESREKMKELAGKVF